MKLARDLTSEVIELKADRANLRLELAILARELAEQKAINLALAERLAACSAVLGRAAERGKVCGCEAEKISAGGVNTLTPPGV